MDEQVQPMLVEMAARVGEEPSTPSKREEKEEDVGGLSAEYAVGIGISDSWDVPPSDDGCEGQVAYVARKCSRGLCGALGARRLGHLAVLHHQEKKDGTRLNCVMGPFWPFAFCVTYPLIFIVSITVAVTKLPGHHIVTKVIWALSVVALLVALSCTACRDPGVLRRHAVQPDANWRWNDQARSFRPPQAVYDDDLGVIVKNFDHTCPWTGTGIGENNLTAFHAFVTLICICIVFDVLIAMDVVP